MSEKPISEDAAEVSKKKRKSVKTEVEDGTSGSAPKKRKGKEKAVLPDELAHRDAGDVSTLKKEKSEKKDRESRDKDEGKEKAIASNDTRGEQDVSLPTDSKELKAHKTDKAKHGDDSADDVNVNEVEERTKVKKSRKKRKRVEDVAKAKGDANVVLEEKNHDGSPRAQPEASESDGSAQATAPTKRDKIEKKKKRRKGEEEQGTLENGSGQATSISKEEKRKRKKRKADTEGGEEVEVALKSSKRKKPKKSKCGFPDPSADSSLGDQAQKALSYAFNQFEEPEVWKFNKARQNWLVRNVWSSEAVPELYMPLLTRYLERVQGGVRDNLIKACHDILSQSTIAEAKESSTSPAASTASLVGDIKKTRASALLEVLEGN